MENLNRTIKLTLISLLILLTNSCNKDLDDNLITAKAQDVITKDAKLYELISNVTTLTNNPLKKITCIDFIYPFHISIYNDKLEQINIQVLESDKQFSDFLGTLTNNQSISISYPISTTLSDKTIFTVNNNQELKLAIDSCSKEDIIANCNNLICSGSLTDQSSCFWYVAITKDADNKYASTYIEANKDGTLQLYYNNTIYKGIWTFLLVNYGLHLNINLEGTSQVAKDWNVDRNVGEIGDVMTIKSIDNPKIMRLKKSLKTNFNYAIGEVGPAGGIVFYDKGSYSFGWRYIEAAPNDFGYFEWGCLGSLIPDANNSEIGRGFFNTATIVNYHDNLLNYYTNPVVCNALNDGSVVAKGAAEYTNNYVIGNSKDWFLPTTNELRLIYENLHLKAKGNFKNSVYWSSTQADDKNAKTIDFSTGNEVLASKIPAINTINARAIRYF